jgi:phage I-like protein
MAHFGYMVDLSTIALDDATMTSTFQAMPYGKYIHPVYGKIDLNYERAQRFAQNVNSGVRGQDLDIDYEHKQHHGEAAGWVKAAVAHPTDGLMLTVEWTKTAYQKIKEKAYRYFSPEFVDEWTHPQTGQKYKDVLFGGGITNRPFLKGIVPINLAEMFDPNDTSVDTEENDEGGSTHMTPEQKKALCERLNLPEGTSDEALYGALMVSTGGTVAAPPEKKAEEPEVKDEKKLEEPEKKDSPTPQVNTKDPELLKLAEHNPSVAALVEYIQNQELQLATSSEALKLAEVNRSVEGLVSKARSKGYALAPVIEDQIREVLVLSENPKLTDKIKKVLDDLVDTGFVFVQLGEKGGSRLDTDDAIAAFNREVTKLTDGENGMAYADAVAKVAQTNPELFEQYRAESYSFRE